MEEKVTEITFGWVWDEWMHQSRSTSHIFVLLCVCVMENKRRRVLGELMASADGGIADKVNIREETGSCLTLANCEFTHFVKVFF